MGKQSCCQKFLALFFLAVFLPCLVPASEADAVASIEQLDSQQSEEHHYSLSASRLNRTRTFSLYEEVKLCTWTNGTCSANILNNVPEPEIVDSLLQTKECHAINNTAECNKSEDCIWSSEVDECLSDLAVSLQSCLSEQWITLVRSTDCDLFATETQCELLSGCQWNSTLQSCLIDTETVLNALLKNVPLAASFVTFQNCTQRSEEQCTGECTLDPTAGCTSLDLFDATRWFIDEESTYCRWRAKSVQCLLKDPTDCKGDCELTKLTNSAQCTETDRVFVEYTYSEEPILQQQMLTALDECPKLLTQAACEKRA